MKVAKALAFTGFRVLDDVIFFNEVSIKIPLVQWTEPDRT